MSATIRFEQTEQAYCPACDSAIAQEAVERHIIPTGPYEPTRQRVEAYCEHCDELYVVCRTLRHGVWELDTGVQLVESNRDRRAARARLAARRGDRQVSR